MAFFAGSNHRVKRHQIPLLLGPCSSVGDEEQSLKSRFLVFETFGNDPRPSKGCLLEAFEYLKTTNKHPLEGAGHCELL